jgi:hypothetical protein
MYLGSYGAGYRYDTQLGLLGLTFGTTMITTTRVISVSQLSFRARRGKFTGDIRLPIQQPNQRTRATLEDGSYWRTAMMRLASDFRQTALSDDVQCWAAVRV